VWNWLLILHKNPNDLMFDNLNAIFLIEKTFKIACQRHRTSPHSRWRTRPICPRRTPTRAPTAPSRPTRPPRPTRTQTLRPTPPRPQLITSNRSTRPRRKLSPFKTPPPNNRVSWRNVYLFWNSQRAGYLKILKCYQTVTNVKLISFDSNKTANWDLILFIRTEATKNETDHQIRNKGPWNQTPQ
jgi:hypothetical protein